MKKNLLSIIILALLVVNIVLSAIMMISVTSASKKTAALVSDISTIIGLEIDGLPKSETVGSVSMANTEVYNISDELTIPLKNDEDGTSHFAVGKVSLSMDKTNKDYETYSPTLESTQWMKPRVTRKSSNQKFYRRFRNYLVQTLFMECPLISCISNISLKSGYRG